jgi:hypothetical protein
MFLYDAEGNETALEGKKLIMDAVNTIYNELFFQLEKGRSLRKQFWAYSRCFK